MACALRTTAGLRWQLEAGANAGCWLPQDLSGPRCVRLPHSLLTQALDAKIAVRARGITFVLNLGLQPSVLEAAQPLVPTDNDRSII